MKHIGVAAYSGSSPELEEAARKFVENLPGRGVRLVLGGYWGVMASAADAAASRGIEVVFVLPEDPPVEPPASELFIPVKTGLDYKGRSIVLVRSSDVLAVLGGESGTMIEVMLAYALGVPVIMLRGTGMASDKLAGCFGEVFDERRTARVAYVDSPEQLAVEAARTAGIS